MTDPKEGWRALFVGGPWHEEERVLGRPKPYVRCPLPVRLTLVEAEPTAVLPTGTYRCSNWHEWYLTVDGIEERLTYEYQGDDA